MVVGWWEWRGRPLRLSRPSKEVLVGCQEPWAGHCAWRRTPFGPSVSLAVREVPDPPQSVCGWIW
ncbi:hypothetical protein DFR70_107372 [Nocardia tenerifensis]|uniref:Uncharacterized protein n=1 Tax=Nocardia tenerifensis TaxID=228006 RepID=A0A318KLQ8_9NOCA|nr:hypothetical protein DFR70_107372 [Nocardia tenerifensis]